MYKVTVIVPVYNAEKYLGRCLKSLFEQTLDSIEYIFIDDCSSDNSVKILQQTIAEYPHRSAHARILRMSKNSGSAAVRKLGMEMANGEYIIHCDSDDWVDVDMYRLMYDKAVDGNYDIVVSRYVLAYDTYIDGNIYFVPDSHYSDKFKLISDLIQPGSNLNNVWSKLVKRRLYCDSNFTFPLEDMGEDMAIMCQLFYLSDRVGYIDKSLYFYYQNQGSISNSSGGNKELKRVCQIKNNFDLILRFLEINKVIDSFKSEIFIRKLAIKERVRACISNDETYHIWRNIYPEINFMTVTSLRLKIIYLLTYLKLDSIFKKIKKVIISQ